MHGRPSSRKPLDSASAESCDAAVARAAWTPTVIVVALGVHAGNGGDGGDVPSDRGTELADAGASDGRADVAEAGADDADTGAHGCGALTQVAGSKDAGAAGVAGNPAC